MTRSSRSPRAVPRLCPSAASGSLASHSAGASLTTRRLVSPLGIEKALTTDLADAALEMIDEVEALGGMGAAIESGMAKLRIEESATRKQARIDAADDVVVGVNKYKPPAPSEGDDQKAGAVDVLAIDNTAVRESQLRMLERIKSERDSNAATAALDNLRAAATATAAADGGAEGVVGDQNLLHLCVEAARVRCTLGEISSALGDVFGEFTPSSPVVQVSRSHATWRGALARRGRDGACATASHRIVHHGAGEWERVSNRVYCRTVTMAATHVPAP